VCNLESGIRAVGVGDESEAVGAGRDRRVFADDACGVEVEVVAAEHVMFEQWATLRSPFVKS
jgi:hypothetical protein